MKHKLYRMGALLLALACSLCLAGCSLARPEAAAAEENKDRLIGLFITTEYLDLFDMEAWLNDNAGALMNGGTLEIEDTAQYENRLYAELAADETGREWVVRFPGVEGWYFLENPANTTIGEEDEYQEPWWTAPNDVHSLGVHFHTDDEKDEITYNGVFYFALNTDPLPESTGEREVIELEDGTAMAELPDDWIDRGAFYPNPVYLTADGRIYTTTGNGMSMSGQESEGESFGITLSSSETLTTNGESRTESMTFSLKFYGVWPTTQYRLMQLDADGQLLQTDTYAPHALPETLDILANTDCLLVERTYTTRGGEIRVEREAFDRSENFVDGSRKMGDLIYGWSSTDESGQTQSVLGLPVLREDAATFDYHELTLILQN